MARWILTLLGRRALHIATLVIFLGISIVSSLPMAALKTATAAHMPNNKTRNSLLSKIMDHNAHFNAESSSTHISEMSRKFLDNSTSTTTTDETDSRYNKTLARRVRRAGHRSRGTHVERFLYSTAKLKQLYCRTGYRLAIYDNGTINGTKSIHNPYSLLSISARSFGVVYIKGVYSGLYVCMDERGTLYGSANAVNDCLFEERLLSNWYTTFSSRTHPITRRNRRHPWYLSLNKDGSARSGSRTKSKHNMAQFLPI